VVSGECADNVCAATVLGVIGLPRQAQILIREFILGGLIVKGWQSVFGLNFTWSDQLLNG
jgi:hypothetical protein